MKRSPDFILRYVANTWVVMPVGTAVLDFPGMIKLNATGCFLWELLEREQTVQSLTRALVEEYEVTEPRAAEDLQTFLERLNAVGAIV